MKYPSPFFLLKQNFNGKIIVRIIVPGLIDQNGKVKKQMKLIRNPNI